MNFLKIKEEELSNLMQAVRTNGTILKFLCKPTYVNVIEKESIKIVTIKL